MGTSRALFAWLVLSVSIAAEAASFSTSKAWVSSISTPTYPGTKQVTLREFLRSKDSLITPELTQLALQVALERSREYLDRWAYEKITTGLLRGLKETFPAKTIQDATASPEMVSLARLTLLVSQLIEPTLGSIGELTSHCYNVFDKLDKPSRKQLAIVFGGLMHLKGGESDDLIQSNAFWKELRDRSCQFRGYVSDSTRPEVWKFWLSHAILSSVLPRDADSVAVQRRLSKDSRIVDNAGRLDTYLSFRGKPIGLSLKTAIDLKRESSDVRSTGKFIGSTAISLLADYGSAWEEAVAKDLRPSKIWDNSPVTVHPPTAKDMSLEALFEALPSNYPTRPASALSRTDQQEIPSAFEIGLVFWWKRIREPQKLPPYGAANALYAKILSTHWLAASLDGFSSHGRWADVLSLDNQKSNPDPNCCARKTFGSSASYAALSYEFESAKKSFEPAFEIARRSDDKYLNEIRDFWLEGFGRMKNELLKMSNGVVEEISEESSKWWGRIQFGTPISSIGVFKTAQKDPVIPAYTNVQLARGAKGFTVPVTIGNTEYNLWVPSTYVIVNFSQQPLSSQEWQNLVKERGL